jgi:ATP-binding cassette subfamily B (MDR/TAP) protein 1
VKGVVGDQLALLTQNGITLIIGFVIAFLASWKLTLVVLSVMPLLIVSGYCQVR